MAAEDGGVQHVDGRHGPGGRPRRERRVVPEPEVAREPVDRHVAHGAPFAMSRMATARDAITTPGTTAVALYINLRNGAKIIGVAATPTGARSWLASRRRFGT